MLTKIIPAIFFAFIIARPISAAQELPIPETIVAGNNAFAIELYQHLKNTPGNLFFSPYSISTALAMTYAGARANTEKQMATTMHFGLDQNKFHAAFGEFQSRLNEYEKKGDIKLEVANSLWLQKDYMFLPAFLEETKKYNAGLNYVNFKSETEKARFAINTWVEKKTNDKIQNLIVPGVLNASTELVLANAIYFKGKWATPFDSSITKNTPFFGISNDSVMVPMMHKAGHEFGYMENSDAECLEMPYAGNHLSMVIILPKNKTGLNKLENAFTEEIFNTWIKSLVKEKVIVFFPKFKALKSFSLTKELQVMEMRDAFNNTADFSGMTGTKDLFISDVIHKAFIDVNEEGTEAAAATAVIMTRGARPQMMPKIPPTFRADHPFLFLIRDTTSGAILFMGRITDPR
jgi:serine protease inhibitor